MRTFIFLSWSGPQSRELAVVLKSFLSQVLKIPKESIFMSAKEVTSMDNGWFDNIRKSLSEAEILIACITKPNISAPWVHFETGVVSNKSLSKKKIIPCLFDVDIQELYRQNLTMFTYHDINSFSANMSIKKMLKRLICQVVNYIADHYLRIEKYYDSIPSLQTINSVDDDIVEKYYNRDKDDTARRITNLIYKYNYHDFFISRPMKGVLPDYSQRMNEIIENLCKIVSDVKVYYADNKKQDFGTQITSYRIEIIKQSAHFILIYPKVEDCNLPPSSCLIELGVALAYNKPVMLFIEKDAKEPEFFKDLRNQCECVQYHDMKDLQDKIEEHINGKYEK